jgi:ferric-dicitrate binding protein FerR (iron transport regulator)
MDCQQAQQEIGRLIDGELPPAELAAVEAHLADCADCGALCDGLRVDDARLLRAFAPRRQASAAVADHVIERLRGERLPIEQASSERPSSERRNRLRRRSWATPLVAAAAGFLLTVIVLRTPWRQPADPPTLPFARLAVATGPTEVRTPREVPWLVCPPSGEIAAGASVRTAAGARCELQASDGSQIRLAQDTEVQLSQPRVVKLARGELYSCVSADGGPFQVETPDAKVAATEGKFNVTCSAGESSLTVVEGSASVECKSGTRQVTQGQRVRLVDGRAQEAVAISDPMQATAWVNELLVLKGADNPELAERLNDILAQIGHTKVSYLYEDEIRRLGSRAALPLVRYVESPRSRASDRSRQTAARIAADLADSTVIGDLIRLLGDDDARVRVYVATALERLTGQNQGRPAAAWQDDRESCLPAVEAWQEWWRERAVGSRQ